IKNKQSNSYRPKYKIGNTSNYNDQDGKQHLRYTYESSGYSGTVEDYQNYYKTLLAIVKDVLGTGYTAIASDRGNVSRTTFLEAGQSVYTSTTSIYVKFDGTF